MAPVLKQQQTLRMLTKPLFYIPNLATWRVTQSIWDDPLVKLRSRWFDDGFKKTPRLANQQRPWRPDLLFESGSPSLIP